MVVSSVLITGARLRLYFTHEVDLPFPFETFVEFGASSRPTSLWAVFVSFAFYRVLFRPRIMFKSNCLLIVLWLKPHFHSRFRKTHRLSRGIENIKKTSARRFVTRRGSSRRSRSRRLNFLDDLSQIYLGDRYLFSPLSSFAWESRIYRLCVSPLPRKVHVSKHPVRDVSQFWTSCVAVCDVWWWPVSSPCFPLLVVSYRCERQMLASSSTHFCQVVYVQKNSLLENLAFLDDLSSVFLIFIIIYDLFCCEMNLPSVASCDSARAHPPFLASSRPPKNLRNEPWLLLLHKSIQYVKV